MILIMSFSLRNTARHFAVLSNGFKGVFPLAMLGKMPKLIIIKKVNRSFNEI